MIYARAFLAIIVLCATVAQAASVSTTNPPTVGYALPNFTPPTSLAGKQYQNGSAGYMLLTQSGYPCFSGALFCGGNVRVVAGYTGPAEVGTCLGGTTSYTINILANGTLDTATMDADCGGLPFRVSQLTNQLGGNINAVQTATPTSIYADARPGVSAYNTVGPARGLAFDTVYRGSSGYPPGEQPNNVYLTLSGLTGITGTNLCMIASVKMDSTSMFGSVVEADPASGSSGAMGLGMFGTATGAAPHIAALQAGNSNAQLPTTPISTTPQVIGTNATPNAWTVSYGPYSVSANVGASTAYTKGIIGATDLSIGNMPFTLGAVVIGPSLSASAYAQAMAAMAALFAIPQNVVEQDIEDGDSRLEGFGSSFMLNWATQMENLLPPDMQVDNVGVWGDTLQNHAANFSIFIQPMYSPTMINNIIDENAAYNDLANASYSSNNTPAQEAATVYGYATTVVTKSHALPGAAGVPNNVTVFLSTVLTNGAPSANVTAAINAYNTLVRNGASPPNYTPGAQTSGYYLSDPAADPVFSSVNFDNPAYSPDQVHLTNVFNAPFAFDKYVSLSPAF